MISRIKRRLNGFVKVGLLAGAAIAFSSNATAAKILVLTTAETATDAIAINNNCVSEFTALQPTHTVVAMPGKLSDNASPLTMQDLSPATGPYDIVVTCTVYAAANQAAVSAIADGMRQRTARAFFNFDEHASFMPAFIAAKNDWTLALSTIRGGSGEPQILNARSIYADAFAGLPVMGGHSYGAYTGVPLDNTLYTPQSAPIPPNSDIVPGASTMVVPIEQSYLDGNGAPQGACLFQSSDVSMFDSVRYLANRGRISAAFINATAPGGACSLSPSISKSFSANSIAAGGTSILTIRINNNGGYTDAAGVFQPGAPVSNLKVQDNLPAPLQLDGVPTTTCSGGALTGSSGQTALGLEGATLPSGGCTITAAVTWPASAVAACTGASVINTINAGVEFTTAGGTAKQNATAALACAPVASVQVSKSVAERNVMAGAAAHFTVSIRNIGPVAGTGIVVSDPVSSDWSSVTWTCSATGGASCPSESGAGAIAVNGLTLPAGGALSYAIAAVSAGSANSATNTVSVSPGNGQCSSGAAPCIASATVAVLGGVQIDKSRTSGATAKVGDTVEYKVQVSNPTGVAVTRPIAIADPLPAGLESGHWTCAGACGTTTSGSLPLAVTLDGLGPQASATFTLSAVAAASGQGASVINTATATPTAPELCLNGQAQCSASADSVQINPSAPATPTAVPSLSQWALALLSLVLGGCAVISVRRTRMH